MMRHRKYTQRQLNELNYLADLEDDIAERDYSVYGDYAQDVLAADKEYARKVAASIKTGRRVWPAKGKASWM